MRIPENKRRHNTQYEVTFKRTYGNREVLGQHWKIPRFPSMSTGKTGALPGPRNVGSLGVLNYAIFASI